MLFSLTKSFHTNLLYENMKCMKHYMQLSLTKKQYSIRCITNLAKFQLHIDHQLQF